MFISESNIIEKGYTQGNQFLLPDGELYKGFYHKDNQGRYWTGEIHDSNSILLKNPYPSITIDNNYVSKNNYISTPYTKIYNKNLDTLLLTNEYIQPTIDDYIEGVFTRYVAQLKSGKTPEQNIVEISKNTFDNVSTNNNILTTYNLKSFKWKLTGPINDVYNNNIKIDNGVLDTNLRSLNDLEKTIVGVRLFITDPLQFYFKPIEPRIY